MNLIDWANIANNAYASKPDLGKEESAGRICFVQSEQGLILAIPGTNNPESFFADIDVLTHDAGQLGEVHKGGYDAFQPLWLDIYHLPIYAIVGHSEGCFGALYLGAQLSLLGKSPKVIYCFEPPRASIDNKLADVFSKSGIELHLMRHGSDIITEVPVAVPFINWQHPKALENFGTACLPFDNFADHYLENIISDLQKTSVHA